jgi:hypothetical protein
MSDKICINPTSCHIIFSEEKKHATLDLAILQLKIEMLKKIMFKLNMLKYVVQINKGFFWIFYVLSTVPEDTGIKLRTVATLALSVRKTLLTLI